MRWVKTDNPRVWEAQDGLHYAAAWDSEYHVGEGYIARVYERPVQPPLFGEPSPARQVVGTATWGLEVESALRMAIKRFDLEAELPLLEAKLP